MKLTSSLSFFLIVTATILLPSCEKVIDLPLSSSTPQIVIQGNIYDEAGPYVVTISKTVPFNQTNTFPPVTGAVVSIHDDAQHSEILTETTPGTYVTSSLRGVAGRTYTLNVSAEGKTYTASSCMPPAVNIDSIYVAPCPWDGSEKMLKFQFLDPANIKNYYRAVEFINNVSVNDGFYVGDDQVSDGKKTTFSIYSQKDEYKLESGQVVAIWLECIDKGVYDYFYSTYNDGSESASPANPVSNISNSALGYFNACSIRKRAIVVPN